MKTILFLCVHNAGRSQMAEAFFHHGAAVRGIEARAVSAGTIEAGSINPVAVQAMHELGIQLDGQFPKRLTQKMVDAADRVISMGCGVDSAACPATFLLTDDWGLDDPAGQTIEAVRPIRDEIQRRVTQLLSELA